MKTRAAEKFERELSPFQLRNIGILTHLLEHDAVTDEVVELLHESEMDYYALIEKYKILDKKVNVDEKTNLLKYKNDYLTNIIKTASRIYLGVLGKLYNVSFIRFDIDNFSRFNSHYGHETGDEVLKEVARVIKNYSRPTDYAIRFGGEEFDVILPSTDVAGAEKYAVKIFRKMQDTTINHHGEKLKVTVSAGISGIEYEFDGRRFVRDEEVEALFKNLQSEADDALYEAISNGKNRYCLYQSNKAETYKQYRSSYCKEMV